MSKPVEERYPLWYCRCVRIIAIVATIVFTHFAARLFSSSWRTIGMMNVAGLYLLSIFLGCVWAFTVLVALTAESEDEDSKEARHA